ncbi:MAG TPA: asparagine synthase (glutamine-hydrolyzing) [Clostridia bacterium]|nr:asparagine synthase (glutamine-hydrolyzing) [Clostridia bacterium]
MCGFVGWVNMERNLADERETIGKMTATLSRRGPDDSGIYLSGNALLGHRRLVVVDPEGGGQPMTRWAGGNSYTLVYNGELYNTDELRSSLIARGYSFNSYSDTEVLLVSYMEWGEDCLKRFNGIYAFGIWDNNNRTLFAARDPLGVKPLFYTLVNGSLIFGSEIKALMAYPEVEPVLDETGIMEIFGLGPARSPGCGVFRGIKEIPPAHCLTYNSDGIRLKQYWQLTAAPHTDDLAATVEKTRTLLIDAIERQMVSDVPVCTFLSGGLDSSAISAVAAGHFKNRGKGVLNTYAIDYVDNELYFKADDYQPNSDSYWADKMAEFIGSNHRTIYIDTRDLTSALKEAVLANDLPGMADIDSSLYLFCKEVRKDATVAISGECADEIFGGYPWYTRQELINSNTFPWSEAVQERKSILSGEFQGIPLEDYIQEKYLGTLGEVPKLEGESKEESRMREMFYLNLKWQMITLLNRKDRMSMSNSLEVRVPFADYRIVEYAYNIPWSIKYCDQREKGLLRRALKGILPDDILERKKSPYPKTHNPEYLRAVREKMTEIMADKRSPLLQLVNPRVVEEIVKSGGIAFGKPWYGQLMRGPQLLAYLIQIDTWMREYKVRVII